MITPATNNANKAIAVLKSLESGDPAAITQWVNQDKYIQHNLNFSSGREAMLGAMDQLTQAGTKVDIKRVLVDGDIVALHTDYNFFGPKAGFDIFRFENGQIVEHWDNLQDKVERTPSGHTMFDGPTEIVDLDKTEENKALVKNFIQDVLMGQNPDKLRSYINENKYIQHNPAVADGLSGLGAYLESMAKQGIEMKYKKIHIVLGQGNFVLAASEGTFGGEHTSFYDLLRIENGKIVEHWDVNETILPKEKWANENGKF
ncbi:Predicted SnoaL-like aldol condensation-catalyzing enzyme [Paenibacillus sp. UNC496MF]|uniref:nuclear transport factor 2 family protein n=1 Tax=Paenibacillus sp. UNC496MF TaxID=1502753 RepID=UPI0008EBCFF1|nr:nuclear transport factor 2 family protein [Paenibacillus sp. UNC496MF]SFJ59602.1 Predicted SnoaL-like aldol condensation-catalyzing enzyme [Paenibacillus sp. UNC496MF]